MDTIDKNKILEEVSAYFDQDGLIQPWPHTGQNATGNGLRYTAETAIMLQRHNLYSARRYAIMSAIGRCELKSGLLKRSPSHPDQNDIDDYNAILAFCAVCKETKFAQDILSYGLQNFWYYNNTEFVFSVDKIFSVNAWKQVIHTWLGRFPTLIAQMYFASNVTPASWRRIYSCATILLASYASRKDQDAWALTMNHINTMIYSSIPLWKLERWVIGKWLLKFKEAFPHGMTQLYTEYFGNNNHPLTKY